MSALLWLSVSTTLNMSGAEACLVRVVCIGVVIPFKLTLPVLVIRRVVVLSVLCA